MHTFRKKVNFLHTQGSVWNTVCDKRRGTRSLPSHSRCLVSKQVRRRSALSHAHTLFLSHTHILVIGHGGCVLQSGCCRQLWRQTPAFRLPRVCECFVGEVGQRGATRHPPLSGVDPRRRPASLAPSCDTSAMCELFTQRDTGT